ncbi:MAG TPA: VC0807 family protein [Rubrivivax sp.]|jgi:intracellular septation protein A|nr:VC0807 family protein [Rubrivivax sp.]
MKPASKPNPLIEIAITILVPALILMKFSGESSLGPVRALLVGLAFPLAWGVWDGVRRRKVSWLAVLGVVSTLLTGGIGLLALDAKWLAVKEAAVPSLMGLVILGSAWTRSPLIKLLVFNATLFDVQRVQAALDERGTAPQFERRLRTGTFLLAATFLFSAIANYVLTRWVVNSPAGTEAFNEELGRLTLLSYPIIAIPSMLMMMALMLWLARGARELTGLALGDMLQAQ